MVTAAAAPQPEIGYVALLSGNKRYRELWLANVISLLGDWLDLIAITELVVNLAAKPGSALTSTGAIAGLMIARFLPSVLMGPLAGNVADRYPRHLVMLWANRISTCFVLLLLPFLTPRGIPIVIALTFLKMSAQAFFLPANQASVPMVVPREHIGEANALGATSWSVMLAVGAAVGAVVVHYLGPQVSLVIDALTFVIANFFLYGLNLPSAAELGAPRQTTGAVFKQGLDFVRSHPYLYGPLFIKTVLGASGSALLFPLMAEHVWPRKNPDGSLAVGYVQGMLYLAFGLGTMLGPILMRRFGKADIRTMFRRLAPSFVATGVLCVIFSISSTLAIGFVWMLLSSVARAILFVYSTTLLQLLVPNNFRGRVFAVEFGLMTLGITIAIIISQRLFDHGIVDARQLGQGLGWLAVIGGLPYFFLRPPEESAQAAD